MKTMKQLTLTLLLMIVAAFCHSQSTSYNYNSVDLGEHVFTQRKAAIERHVDSAYKKAEPVFRKAYAKYPRLPRGILEAISYYYTRFNFVPYNEKDIGSADDIPKTYGIMGLTLDGKGIFRDNLTMVSDLSGVPLPDILTSPQDGVIAYASAFDKLQKRFGIYSDSIENYTSILIELSELPFDNNWEENYPMQSYIYSIFEFLSDYETNSKYEVPQRNINMDKIFGKRIELLRSPKVRLSDGKACAATDYEPAIWNPAGSCNYTAMESRNISAITIHYTSGTYAGSIAWFQNCTYNGVGARASAHYVIRSSDGQITQMVREKDKAWHVRTENGYTIGIEHEAYGDVYSFFTPAMYNSSAALVRNICSRYHINPHRTFYRDTLDDGTCLNVGTHNLGGQSACTQIRGHQHFPNQTHTDPGPYWDWNYYYKLLNPNPQTKVFNATSGILTDSGGENNDYNCDERSLYIIEIPNAKKITLSFSEFALEKDYDFLWIYDGNSVYSPLIGRWNTVSPGTVTSTSNSLLLEFRSDFAITASGWKALWEAEFDTANDVEDAAPHTEIMLDENKWQTKDFAVGFNDSDDGEIKHSFYQVMENDGLEWKANGNRGFLCSNFDQQLEKTDWEIVSGNWKMLVHRLEQTNISANNATIAIPFNPTESDAYLYDIYANILESENNDCKACIYFCIDDKNEKKNGYCLEILPIEKKMKLYRLKNGTKTVLKTIGNCITNLNQNYLYRICHDKASRTIKVFRHNSVLMEVYDGLPPTISNGYFMIGTSNCRAAFDNLRAYRSRDSQVVITVGTGNQKDVTCQAIGGVSKCKVKSIVIDAADNFSALEEKSVLIDYTAPPKPKWVKVAPYPDNICEYNNGHVKITWECTDDLHSSPVEYLYQISEVGSSGSETASKWSTAGENCEVIVGPIFEKGKSYLVRVMSQNQAGLKSKAAVSSPFISGGHSVHKNLSAIVNTGGDNGIMAEYVSEKKAGADAKLSLYPNPASTEIAIIGADAGAYGIISDMSGRAVHTFELDNTCKIDVSGLPRGMYVINMSNKSARFVKY